MAKVCEKCGKSTKSGQRKRHHHAANWMFRSPRTKRVFKPSLRSVKVNIDGKMKKMTVCMRCYRTLTAKA